MQISIIEFSIKNYKLFRDKTTISTLSRKHPYHTFETNSENLLKTTLIYGPNASGKTSLLEAMNRMVDMVRISANSREAGDIPYYEPYAGGGENNEPVEFEVVFALNNNYQGVYKYSISLLNDKFGYEFLKELKPSGDEELLFERSDEGINLGKHYKDDGILINKTRKDSLFLSVSAQFNNEFSVSVVKAFENINYLSGINFRGYQRYTLDLLKKDEKSKLILLNYLKQADFCISGANTQEVDVHKVHIEDKEENFTATKKIEKGTALFLEHPVYDKKSNVVGVFSVALDEESSGTQKFLSVLGPIIDTLSHGKVLLIDEFDNSLHPLLTKFITDLFVSPETNKNGAQLIVTTHDISLLSYKEDYIKDQFWFTEKDQCGVARVFPLSEFDMRNDTEYAKKYLEGRFGALPFVGSLKR